MKRDLFFKSLNAEIGKTAFANKKLTLGETVDLAESLGVRMSDIVIAEAMAAHQMTHDEVIEAVLGAFGFNLLALEIGLNQDAPLLQDRTGGGQLCCRKGAGGRTGFRPARARARARKSGSSR